jgi:DNA repair protein RadC
MNFRIGTTADGVFRYLLDHPPLAFDNIGSYAGNHDAKQRQLEDHRSMKNFNNVETIYTKRLKTVQVKLNLDYIADPSEDDKQKAECPDEIYEILKSLYRQLDDDQEHMIMLVLNVSNEVIGFKVIASGTQTSGPADAKIIFRSALMLGATKIVLAHNHPSGNLKPSSADIRFTQKVIEAGRVMDIPLVDHLIMTHKGYISMRAGNCCKFDSFI